jgi:hypothetical protein
VARAIALLVNPTNPLAQPILNESQTAARILGLQLQVPHASNEGDFDAAFKAAVEVRADALVIASADPLFGSRAEQLGALDSIHRQSDAGGRMLL